MPSTYSIVGFEPRTGIISGSGSVLELSQALRPASPSPGELKWGSPSLKGLIVHIDEEFAYAGSQIGYLLEFLTI